MNKFSNNTKGMAFLPLFGFLLASCSGGSSSPAPAPVVTTPPPPVTETGPTWTKGVFEDASEFEAMCENPRTGINPGTGVAYPDQEGSTLYENHWLRSWSDDTYLWYSEIEDQDPAGFNDPLVYFDELMTTAITPSGTPKDQFHFTYDTAEYQELVSSGSSAGYGMDFVLISASPPREVRVVLTEPNSPAASNNIMRGAEILEVDGVDLVNGGTQADVDALNAGLFPSELGESHSFTIRDLGSSTTRTFTMTTADVVTDPVQFTKTIDTANGKVGYLLFNTFGIYDAETEIVGAMTDLASQGVSDLVIDLRYNGGGFLDISGELGYMVAGATTTSGKIFDKTTFNDKHPTVNPVTGQVLTPTPFHDTTLGFSIDSGQALPSLDLNRVFILSTDGTCSASEALINGLRGVDVEVVLIGSTTCGKPYGFYATDNCGTTYFTIQFKGENDKGFGEYSDGFSPMNASGTIGELIPGCEVADDYSHGFGDVEEAMLKTALSYRETGSCPVATASTIKQVSTKASFVQKMSQSEVGSLYNSDHMRKHLIKEQILNQHARQQ